jgi:hypothetical protein
MERRGLISSFKLYSRAFARLEEGGLGVGTLWLEGDGEGEQDDSESFDLLNEGEGRCSMRCKV